MSDESPAVGEVTFCVICGGVAGWYCAEPEHDHRPTIERAAVSDPDADTTVSYEVRCAHGHHPVAYSADSADVARTKAEVRNTNIFGRSQCKPWVAVKVTTTTTREVLS